MGMCLPVRSKIFMLFASLIMMLVDSQLEASNGFRDSKEGSKKRSSLQVIKEKVKDEVKK